MPTPDWSFRQGDYVTTHSLQGIGTSSEGVCSAAAYRWVKMILKKSGWADFKEPILDNEARESYFAKGSAAVKIANRQKELDEDYGEVDEWSKRMAQVLRQEKSQHSEEKKRISSDKTLTPMGRVAEIRAMEANFEAKINSLLFSKKERVYSARQDLAKKYGLNIDQGNFCAHMPTYFLNIQPGSCYIFFSNGAEHTFSGYVTEGVPHKTYHFFDPNSGEFKRTGENAIAILMGQFERHYRQIVKKPSTDAIRYRVERI